MQVTLNWIVAQITARGGNATYTPLKDAAAKDEALNKGAIDANGAGGKTRRLYKEGAAARFAIMYARTNPSNRSKCAVLPAPATPSEASNQATAMVLEQKLNALTERVDLLALSASRIENALERMAQAWA